MNVQRHLDPGKYLLRVEDYLSLNEAGAFGNERTELLDGDIIIMNAEHRPHAWIAGELGYRIRRCLEKMGSDAYVLSASIALSDHDMPLPDIVLTREPRGSGPIPSRSVVLVIEVASSTMDRDMRSKVGIYARAGVAEYWVADVNGRVIHQMWVPTGETYAEHRDVEFGSDITAATFEGLAIGTDQL